MTVWEFNKVGNPTGQPPTTNTQSLSNLLWEINERHPELPLAIAESNMLNMAIPKMDNKALSLITLNKALAAYGISLKAAESEQPFFVLYEGEQFIPQLKP